MNEYIQEKINYILEAIVAFKIGKINEYQQTLAIRSALKDMYNRGVEDSLSVIEKNYFGLFERKEAIEEITKLLTNK